MIASTEQAVLFRHQGRWQWRLPARFNIGVSCTSAHVQGAAADTPAMIVEQGPQQQQISYRQLALRSDAFAAALRAYGLRPGDRFLIRLPNSIDYPIAFFGALKAGIIALPSSSLLSPRELHYLLADSGAKGMLCESDFWTKLSALPMPRRLRLAILRGPLQQPSKGVTMVTMEKLLQHDASTFQPYNSRLDEPAYLVYTSGTTGHPKGVLHAHRSLLGRRPASSHWFSFQGRDRILHSGQFNWTYVLGSALMDPLSLGHTVVAYEGEKKADVWMQLVRRHRCSIFIGVPTIYRQILQKTATSGADVPTLRHCMSAGESLNDALLQHWQQRFSLPIYEAIGMSECSYYLSQHRHIPLRPGSAGKPQPGHRVELLDNHLQPVADNNEGMLAIAADDPGLFLRYWRRPQENMRCRREGWFLTGDYAIRDNAGYFWFLGRRDEIINSFGYRISPIEVERCLKSHPDVEDCAVAGCQPEAGKTLITAFVVAREGCTQESLEQALRLFVDTELARYKQPKIYRFLSTLPKTKNNKLLRKALPTL